MVHRRTRMLLWITVPVCVVVVLAWAVTYFERGIKTAYYEWGTTCIIVSYAEEHEGKPPAQWSDLIGYEYYSPYLPEPRTIDAMSEHVSVDFDLLVAFHAGKVPQLNQTVVAPLRGFEMHWVNPKTSLEQYFRGGQRPKGSLDRDEAEQLRYNTESEDRLSHIPK